jgi:hypothetical protein
MVLTGQKKHKERRETGECSEGLPGSTKSVGCVLHFDKLSTSDRLLEAEIDQLVYQLYGLTAEEIAIVEGTTND